VTDNRCSWVHYSVGRSKLQKAEEIQWHCPSNNNRMVNSKWMTWVRHVEHMRKNCLQTFGQRTWKDKKHWKTYKVNVSAVPKLAFKIGWDRADRDCDVQDSASIKAGSFLSSSRTISNPRTVLLHRVQAQHITSCVSYNTHAVCIAKWRPIVRNCHTFAVEWTGSADNRQPMSEEWHRHGER
jgi:hypothetical protein